MNPKYGAGPLRARYESQITGEAAAELSTFKSKAANFKLGYWDPRVNGVRYLKALIYNLAAGLSSANRARLRRIHNRDVGDPITVRYDGEVICLDFLLAVFELEFITANIDLDGLSIVEIGAGYGRTCHAILCNHDVTTYTIIDLGKSLELSKGYLRAVLDDEQFAKVKFVAADDVDDVLAAKRFDVAININSFAEMPVETVRNYLAFVDERCRYLYVKDPVGKYLDTSLDGHSQGRELVELALRTGLLQEVIDIHDSEAVEVHARKFVAAYQPGARWQPIANGWAVPWSFYWQVLYENGSNHR